MLYTIPYYVSRKFKTKSKTLQNVCKEKLQQRQNATLNLTTVIFQNSLELL